MGEIIVRVIALPLTVKGLTVKDDNDDYNIYINECLSFIDRQRTIIHELRHIHRGDFYDPRPVIQKEQ